MPGAWITVRVFISSTFRDMHAERDHLVKVTFPALREKLLPHRVELYDIDLRWGITEDEAKNEKVISLCLEQVDECRPFFLAFLGHRYGWVPDQVPQDTQQRFPFVSRCAGISVTELEIRYGAMRDRAGGHTLILLRKDDAVASIPAATRERNFVETDPQRQQQLADLKRKLKVGPYPVQTYSANWNPTQYDRVNRTEGKLDGLKEFGKHVEDWLWQAICKKLQLPKTPAIVDPLDAEADLHERFLELRTRGYIGRDSLYRRLCDFALAHGEFPLLLSGESGLGKSSALARFVRDFRKEHPDMFVLPHFVGASPRTTSLAGMLQRLTQELQRKFKLILPKAESPEEIIRTFVVAITSLPESGCVVLVLDALNQLDADSRAETLIWLPEKLPPNVRVLCSSTTGPHKAPCVLTAFGERKCAVVPLNSLGDDERGDMIRAVPKVVAKTLDNQQIDALLANQATRNPLFLMVALEELRGYGSFENLNKLIAKLPREEDALTKLFEQVFERLEKEFGKRLVEEVLSLLVCARRGLSGLELVKLTRHLGPQADELYPLLRQLAPYLYRRVGRYDLYHMSIRRAVELYYLKWDDEENRSDPWLRWHPDRQMPASDPTEPERETRHRLIDLFESNLLDSRAVDEIPWQLAQLRNWQCLFDLLGNVEFFALALRTNEFEVRTAWSLVKTYGGLEPVEAYRTVLASPANYDEGAVWSLAWWLQTSGYGAIVMPLWSFFIDQCRVTSNDHKLNRCLGNRAVLLMATGKPNEALRLVREQEVICRRLNDSAELSKCLGNQGAILRAVGDFDGAMRLLKEVEVTYRQLNDPDGLQRTLGNQALILRAIGNPVKAMRLHQEEEAICRRLNDPAGLQRSLGNQAAILKDSGDLQKAMCLFKEQESVCRRLNDPVGLSHSLCGRAMILKDTEDRDGAMRLLKEQEAICRRVDDPTGLSMSLCGQALILRDTGDLDGAQRLYKEEESICRQTNDPIRLSTCLSNQAVLLKEAGDLDGAMRIFEEQDAICRRLNYPLGRSLSLGNQGMVLMAMGDLEGAMSLLEKQQAICERINDSVGLATCLGNQALILINAGDLNGATTLLQDQEAICRQINDLPGLSRSLLNQGLILTNTDDVVGAMRLFKEQEAICRRINDSNGLAISFVSQASILAFDQSQPAEGLALAEEALHIATKYGLIALAEQFEPTINKIRDLLK